MYGFTLNTDILMIASGTSDKADDGGNCFSLLTWMMDTVNARLVLDDTQKISAEYGRKMKAECLGRAFVAKMMKDDKIERVARAGGDSWKRARLQLKLHTEDQDFVRAAMASRDKLLVAEEADFHRRRAALKAHAEVLLHSAEEAVELTKAA